MKKEYELRQIEDLQSGDHLCCIYQSEEEHRGLLTPFLRQGLERREKVVYIVDNHTADEVLAYLEDDGVEVASYLESGQLVIISKDDAYMKEGVFDPDGMIVLLTEEMQLASEQGYSALRITGEMTWALKNLPGSERLIEYEAKLNHFIPRNNVVAVCQYDRRRFSPETLLDVIRTHPIVVLGTEIHDNFYYVPPEEFLKKMLPEATLNNWIANLTDRKKSEHALRESEEKYRRIVDSAQEGIWVSNADRVTIFINRRMAEMLGYEAEDLVGRSMIDFIPEQEVASHRERWKRRRQGIDEQFELRMIRKDGSIIYTNISAAPAMDGDGKFDGSVSLVTDITEKKKAEEELRETRDYLESLIRYANAPIIVWDPETEIIRVNDAFEHLTGYKKEEMLDQPLDILFSADDKDEAMAKIALALAGEYLESVEIPVRRKDGETRIALWNSANIYGHNGELVATIAQGQDITDRKRHEKELLESRELLQRSFDVVGDAMFIIDTQCRIQQHNQGLCKLLGKTGDLRGQTCFELMHCSEQPPQFCIMVEAMRTKQAVQGEIYEPTADKHLAVSLAPIFNDCGEVEMGVHVITDITERKKVEEAIRESEEKYRLIVDNALEGIWTIDEHAMTTYVNPRMAAMLGYSAEEMIGLSTFDLVAPEDLELQKYQFGQRKLGTTEQFDMAWVRKDGSILYSTVHGSPILDEDGRLLRVIRFISDITERKKAEDALRESEEKYRLIVDTAQEGIWTINEESTVVYCNERMAQMLGYRVDETVGHPVFEFMDEKNREVARGSIERRRQGIGESYDFELRRKDGTPLYTSVNASPLSGDDGRYLGALGFFTDITSRKAAEDALRESEEKYRLIVDNAHEGIWSVDENRVTTFINARMAEMLGRSAEELMGRPASDVLDQEGNVIANANLERRRMGISESHEFRFVRPDGSMLHASINSSPLFDDDGNFRGSSSFLADMTERKKAEEALARELEINKSIAELSATLLTKASIRTISVMVLGIAQRLTGSCIGHVGYINAESDSLYYTSVDTSQAPDKMFDFKELKGVKPPAIEKRHAFFTNSAPQERRAFKGPLHGAALEKFIWVPSLMGETQVGQISMANADRDYDEKDVELLQKLADIYAVALLRMWSEEELEAYRLHLEDLVKQRTRELDRINRQLESEIAERKSKEKALRQTASRLRALSARLQSIREEERRAVALDVHDKLGQSLTALKINTSLLKKKIAGQKDLEERIDGMSGLIDDTIKTVREIAAELRPGMLDDFGFIPALEWQLKRFKESTGLEYGLTSDLEDEALDKERTVTLFRIAQEALTNVARHSSATEVDVHVFRDAGSLVLEIRDNGKGIREEEASGAGSLGILGMKERALVFGGSVELKGEARKGTLLIARIPFGQVRMDINEEGYDVRN